MVAVLPDGLHNDERSIGRDSPKDFHSALLTIDETVAFFGVELVAANDVAAAIANGGDDGTLGGLLGGPAHAICGQAQIAVSNKTDGSCHDRPYSVTRDSVTGGGAVLHCCSWRSNSANARGSLFWMSAAGLLWASRWPSYVSASAVSPSQGPRACCSICSTAITSTVPVSADSLSGIPR